MSIASELTKLENNRSNIVAAINDKGGTLDAKSGLAACPAAIRAIQTGSDTTDATATSDDILLNKTAYANGTKLTGTIVTQGATTYAPSTSPVTIPAKTYLSEGISIDAVTADNLPTALKETKSVTAPLTGSSIVNPTSGKLMTQVTVNAADTTGTATVNDILSGKTAYVNGAQITGNILSKGAETYSPSDTGKTISAGVYLSGDQVIEAVTAANIPATLKETKTGTASLVDSVVISATTGKVMTQVTVSKPDMSAATATAANIQRGATAYGADGTLITGTHDETTITDMTADATATGTDILLNKTAYVNGAKVTGSIESIAAQTYNPSTADQVISTGKYIAGDQTIKGVTVDNIPLTLKSTQTVTGSLTTYQTVTPVPGTLLTQIIVNNPDMSAADVTAEDIANGKKAYGADGTIITGTHVCSGGIDTSDATAESTDIIKGKTAYVNGQKVTGILDTITVFTVTAVPKATEGEAGDICIITS